MADDQIGLGKFSYLGLTILGFMVGGVGFAVFGKTLLAACAWTGAGVLLIVWVIDVVFLDGMLNDRWAIRGTTRRRYNGLSPQRPRPQKLWSWGWFGYLVDRFGFRYIEPEPPYIPEYYVDHEEFNLTGIRRLHGICDDGLRYAVSDAPEDLRDS